MPLRRATQPQVLAAYKEGGYQKTAGAYYEDITTVLQPLPFNVSEVHGDSVLWIPEAFPCGDGESHVRDCSPSWRYLPALCQLIPHILDMCVLAISRHCHRQSNRSVINSGNKQ